MQMSEGVRVDWENPGAIALDALLKIKKNCEDEINRNRAKAGDYYPYLDRRLNEIKRMAEDGLRNG